MSKITTRDSWKHLAIPQQQALLSVNLSFSTLELAKLSAGEIPKQMEDRWFIYCEQPWIYLHRSWSGICVFQACLEPQGNTFRVGKVIANRDASQYRWQSDETDVLLLSALLSRLAGRDAESLWDRYVTAIRNVGPTDKG